MRHCRILALIAATIVAGTTAAAAQIVSTGWQAGATFARETGAYFTRPNEGLTAGAVLNAELSPRVTFGGEFDYVRKGGGYMYGPEELRLHYLELPVFVRVHGPPRWNALRYFARFAIAPAALVHCAGGNIDPNPELGGVTWSTVQRGSYVVADCDIERENIDVGWQAGVGKTFRTGRVERAIELRITNGIKNQAARYRHPPLRSQVLSIIFSKVTRDF